MKQIHVDAVGMFWYRNAPQYADYLTIFEDSHLLPKTFSQWHKRAVQGRENLVRQGHVVFEISASPVEFRTYCVKIGLNLDAEGRKSFANFKTKEKLAEPKVT